ncbi:MAG: helicase C-terminal domain-containing protein [Candidatus Thiodiazotropha taylori]|nr:helicase C-terminal domain-containing protein [Candidatus Thiodiazotropha taylori]
MTDTQKRRHETPQEEFRNALIDQLRLELIGPSEPAEVIDESPRQRYSAGVLFPSQQTNLEIEDDNSVEGNDTSTEEVQNESEVPDIQKASSVASRSSREEMSAGYDDTITMANTYMPAAMGISFICDNISAELLVSPRAAVYKSAKRKEGNREFNIWQRTELKLPRVKLSLDLTTGQNVRIQEASPHEYLKVKAIIRRRKDDSRLITVSLYNAKKAEGSMPSPADCYYQTGFCVEAVDGFRVFRPYQELISTSDDPEEQGLRLLFRNRLSFGLGHGCAVNWNKDAEYRAKFVETDSLPTMKIPPVEPRQTDGDELNMFMLAGGTDWMQIERVPSLLAALADDYEQWIHNQANEIASLDPSLKTTAERHIGKCREACKRIRNGITVLLESNNALKAFCLANRAMLMQQYHSRRKARGTDDEWEEITTDYLPHETWMGRWRTFQIAFILMNLPSVTPDRSGKFPVDRDFVDLIWFPTGGGKTEAYLGLAAYTIFLRRLTEPSDSGCSVLMRYTLRLLTAQQFQRASALICACETIRQSCPETLGSDQITIGLWVGLSLTPNTRQDALKTLNNLISKPRETENKFQLLKCPWCGTRLNDSNKLGYRSVRVGRPQKVVRFVCPESRCSYSTTTNPLPVLVTDEDIYDEPPTLLIGTVDKFAMLAWREEAGRIFGAGMSVSPPGLIIQDELHLISGPLGTVVGLYEGIIDQLCTKEGLKPKIVGSTATIRRAEQQCRALYNRPTFQFPPPGLDISDSYFAAENPDAAGRLYTGVFASAAPSFVTANIRTAASLLQGCRTLDPADDNDAVRDPYWTLVQYFNSLRELGRALTLLQADIPEYMWTIASRSQVPREKVRYLNRIEELTSRKTAQEIPEILEDLEVTYPQDKGGNKRPVDALLATNMISVGVDVDRLGLMSIIGQPKTTSEYIQASSRVGRSKDAPGMVVTMYNPGKPRDRSHFEQFRTYHASLYRYVEPTSVTPYSIPSLQRALHSLLIIIGRHIGMWKTPADADFMQPTVSDALSELTERCKAIDSEHLEVFIERLARLQDHWASESFHDWGGFTEPDPDELPLMYPAGMPELAEWVDASWSTPTSMRSVDKESEALVLSVYPD